MTDLRDLCAKMADELDHYRQLLMDDRREVHALATEARDALAETEPEPEGLTDEELLCIAAEAIDGYGNCGIKPGEYEEVTEQAVEAYGSELIAYARAVLARWGNRSVPQPVPVSERLPEPGDDVDSILRLSQIIREVDGSHNLGAAALAEAILNHPDNRWAIPLPQPIPLDERLPGPGDEEIVELMPQPMRDDLAAAARAMLGLDCDDTKVRTPLAFRSILNIFNRHSVDHARAVLARWGK